MLQNLRATTIKLLEENIELNIFKLKLSNSFLDTILKAQMRKEKVDKLYYIKIINICAAKTIKKMKKSTEWEKMHHIANNISDKELISRICFKNA